MTVPDVSRAAGFHEAQQYRLDARIVQLREAQRLLEQSLERYAHLYEFSPIGYVSMDENGCVRVLNLAAAELLGADRARVVGQSLAQFVDEASLQRFAAHLKTCLAGLSRVKSELSLTAANGVREVELISVCSDSDASEGTLFRTAIIDITDRKRSAEALRENEAKLRWLIDNMPAVLWIRDEHGSPRYVSANISHVLGFAEHEIRSGGASFWSANIHPDDRERVNTAYARMINTPETGGPAAYDIEYRRQTRDGHWVWVVDRGMSVSEENGVRYASGMFWDTSRRKRMQEQLRESEERFRLLAENIDDVFFLTDLDGSRVYYVSPTFERVWGFSRDRLYRDPASWLELVHEDDSKRVQRAVRARRPDTPYDIEFRIRRTDGAVRWIRLRGFPIGEVSGRVYRVAGIAVDVTARKEVAESLLRSHEQMRAHALHLQSAREEERKHIAREIHDELGALLLAIKMDAEACRKGCPVTAHSETMQRLIGRIDTAIDSMRRIATDLRPSILDHLGVLAAVEWEAQDIERRTGIECVVETDPDKEDLDIAPEPATAIFRIVQEALANVVRHSGATKVKIALREEGGNVRLQITDNGRGIRLESRPGARRWGLVGMAERVNAFNGKFGIDAVAPHGTVITATIPARSPLAGRKLRPRL
ncbi:MAG: PAS domain S-box protein [Betaproteobacteria bacterium]